MKSFNTLIGFLLYPENIRHHQFVRRLHMFARVQIPRGTWTPYYTVSSTLLKSCGIGECGQCDPHSKENEDGV